LSEIRVTTVSDTAGTGPVTLTKQSAAKVYANYNSDATLRDSLNTSSITDAATGNADINFTNNMANTDYAICGLNSSWHQYHTNGGKLANKMRIVGGSSSHAASDQSQNNGFAFGDLA
jgi:hypothetical protein